MSIIRLIFCILSVTFVCAMGCVTRSDPLAGWKVVPAEDPNKTIATDYQDYIQKLPPKERNYVGPVFYYEDKTGQHAVSFEVYKYGKDVWNHYLFYDTNNTRIKVVKRYRGQYWNP